MGCLFLYTIRNIPVRKAVWNLDLKKAKDLLMSGEYTCVLCKGESVYTSTQRGVKPLVQWHRSGTGFAAFSAADKVIGKATAFLYVLLQVRAVYAHVISRSALAVLRENGIDAEYGTLVENIINRKGDGICPFEATVTQIRTPDAAYTAILEKMQEMNIPY